MRKPLIQPWPFVAPSFTAGSVAGRVPVSNIRVPGRPQSFSGPGLAWPLLGA